MRPDCAVDPSEFSQLPPMLVDVNSPSRGSFQSSLLSGVIASIEEVACHHGFGQLEYTSVLIVSAYQ